MTNQAVVKWLTAGLALAGLTGCRSGEVTTPRAAAASNGPGKVIVADCVVTFFSDANKGEYYSTQRHQISPVSDTVLIRASEPQGEFAWRLSGDSYECSIPSAAGKNAPATVIDREVVLAIKTCFTASAGYCDLSRARALDKVKIDGRWYEPFQLPPGRGGGEVTVFLLPDEGRINLVRVASPSGDRIVTAHGYNAHWLKDVNRYVPSKIDVSEKTSAGFPVRILRIDYETFNVADKLD